VDFPIKNVEETVLAKHSLMKRLAAESEVILSTMSKLMQKQIPSYPVHDSLIVRRRWQDQ
jgi:hypothetical protein